MNQDAVLDTSNDVTAAIREDLKNLAAAYDQKNTAAYTKAVLTKLFYDIEHALAVGATQRQVHQLIVEHGIPLPFTRFCQDMSRLRAAMPPHIHEPKLDALAIAKLSDSIGRLSVESKAIEALIELEDRRSKMKSTEFVGKARPRPVEPQVPAVERVRFCARAVLDLAEGVETNPDAISARMRVILGTGWTIQSVFQFVVGSVYADWVNAPWPTEEEGKVVELARVLAKSVVPDAKKVPEKSYLVRAVRESWQRMQSFQNLNHTDGCLRAVG